MNKVLITGGTGLVGIRVNQLLKSNGYKTLLLSSSQKSHPDFEATYSWNPKKQEIDKAALADCDFIVHLAGQNIAQKKWTSSVKKEIISSRTESSSLLFQTIKENNFSIKAMIAASAIGYYGHQKEEVQKETSAPGNGFLSEVCQAWEAATTPFSAVTRLVQLRIGIVLSTRGGALQQMMKSTQFGVGAYLGGGHQHYSWIHIDDLCSMILFAIQNQEVAGVFNAVSPVSATQMTLADTLRYASNKPSVAFPVPSFLLRLAMGEMADIALDSCKVSSQKIVNAGFKFQYKTISAALHHLLKEKV